MDMVLVFVLGVGCAHVFDRLGVWEWLKSLNDDES